MFVDALKEATMYQKNSLEVKKHFQRKFTQYDLLLYLVRNTSSSPLKINAILSRYHRRFLAPIYLC